MAASKNYSVCFSINITVVFFVFYIVYLSSFIMHLSVKLMSSTFFYFFSLLPWNIFRPLSRYPDTTPTNCLLKSPMPSTSVEVYSLRSEGQNAKNKNDTLYISLEKVTVPICSNTIFFMLVVIYCINSIPCNFIQ